MTREDGADVPPELGIVDWARTGRRVRTSGAVVAVLVVVAWVVEGLLGGGLRLADLGDWVGLGLFVMVVTEVVVVGGAAVRAERRAAVRGERLGSEDIGLLPPRIPRPGGVRDAASSDAPGDDEPDEVGGRRPSVTGDGPGGQGSRS